MQVSPLPEILATHAESIAAARDPIVLRNDFD
jgi:hypothetical protein